MTDISSLPTDPLGTPAQGTELIPALRDGTPVALTPAQIILGLQTALGLPAGSLLGRSVTGTGAPSSVAVGQGLTLAGASLVATAADHLSLPLLTLLDLAAELVVNSGAAPSRLPLSLLLNWITLNAPPPEGLVLTDSYGRYFTDSYGGVFTL